MFLQSVVESLSILLLYTYNGNQSTSFLSTLMKFLGNFVHSGNVNQGLSQTAQVNLGEFENWPSYQSTAVDPATLGPQDWVSSRLVAPYPDVEQEPIEKYCSFWDEIGYDFKLFGGGNEILEAFKDLGVL